MRFDSLIDALQEALRQEVSLVSVLTAEQYRASAEGHFSSSIGMHLRHNLDHFEAFFKGLDSNEIDYESRSRNGQVEDVPEVAIDVLNHFIVHLQGLRLRADAVVQVREESEASTVERRWLTSSIGRELQFLLGHTVHHNAIIAMIVERHGLQIPQGFGVAASTQRHQSNLEPVTSA